jgi:hypothetical protein
MAKRKTTKRAIKANGTAAAAPMKAAKGKKAGPRAPKTPAALAKKIAGNRSKRAKAEATIDAQRQRIAGLDKDLDALVAAALSAG